MATQPFVAEMDGQCPACGEPIEPGQRICRTDDGRYVHAEECPEEWEG
jgi:predicted nucleic acid-binding Zn ribbon protein